MMEDSEDESANVFASAAGEDDTLPPIHSIWDDDRFKKVRDKDNKPRWTCGWCHYSGSGFNATKTLWHVAGVPGKDVRRCKGKIDPLYKRRYELLLSKQQIKWKSTEVIALQQNVSIESHHPLVRYFNFCPGLRYTSISARLFYSTRIACPRSKKYGKKSLLSTKTFLLSSSFVLPWKFFIPQAASENKTVKNFVHVFLEVFEPVFNFLFRLFPFLDY